MHWVGLRLHCPFCSSQTTSLRCALCLRPGSQRPVSKAWFFSVKNRKGFLDSTFKCLSSPYSDTMEITGTMSRGLNLVCFLATHLCVFRIWKCRPEITICICNLKSFLLPDKSHTAAKTFSNSSEHQSWFSEFSVPFVLKISNGPKENAGTDCSCGFIIPSRALSSHLESVPSLSRGFVSPSHHKILRISILFYCFIVLYLSTLKYGKCL